MIFCKDCGEVLNLFATHDEEVCSACLRKGITQELSASIQEKGDADLLSDILLGHEDDKMVARSPEGWVLWSAPDNEKHSLGSILVRARRIHEIRRRSRK
jgi:hypothetical protein